MLSLFSSIYGRIASLRNYLYDKGIFETFDLGARTISVGNITTGGTGKTPLVAYIARILAERGERVCILTRGYGRKNPRSRVLVSDGEKVLADATASGDEPFELAHKLLGKAIVIADADRVAAAEGAKRKFGVTAFVLDDGFQHRKVKRDLDIVCIDATNPFGGGKMLPGGRLREPVSYLARSNVFVITRANLVLPDKISNLKSEISDLSKDAAIFMAGNAVSCLVPIEDFRERSRKHTGKMEYARSFAFCAIGNADNFFDQLKKEKFDVAGTFAFRDHHIYSQHDVDEINKQARVAAAEILVTTAKDAVKLSNLKFEIPCFVVEIDVQIDDPEGFKRLL